MMIKDVGRLCRAKIRDWRFGRNFYYPNNKKCLKLRGLDLSSNEFAEALDDYWLFSRQEINFKKRRIGATKSLLGKYEDNSRAEIILSDLTQKLEDSLLISENMVSLLGEFRKSYYGWKRGDIIYKDFENYCEDFLESIRDIKSPIDNLRKGVFSNAD